METNLKSIFSGLNVNVGRSERIVSAVSGSILLFNALRRGKPIQTLLAGYLVFRGATGHCSAYQAIGKKSIDKVQNINIKTNLSINRPVSEVYTFWRKLENLPLFMDHLESVREINEKTSEWKAKIPGGMGTIDWKSVIVEDEPNDRIGWRSLPGSEIETAGNVHFRDAGSFGTNVYAVISYKAPGGQVGETIGRLLNPAFENMVKSDLKNFKTYMETDEEIPVL